MSASTPRPDRTGWLDWDDYLRTLRMDSARLSEATGLGLESPVPSCPDWTVADLLQHTALVYLHKAEWMRTGSPPSPWPPAGIEDREPRSLYAQAIGELFDELTARDPDELRGTWWPEDQTVGFWYRRMALETAVHRVDAELAHDVVTPVDQALALDGIDEVLRIMLRAPWLADQPSAEPIDDRVRVSAAGRSWTVTLDANAVNVAEDDTSDVGVEIAGSPDDVYLWLWGRRDDSRLAVVGDSAIASAFRRRLQDAT